MRGFAGRSSSESTQAGSWAGGSRETLETVETLWKPCCSLDPRRGGVGLLWLGALLRGFFLPCNFPPYRGRISRPSSTSLFPWLPRTGGNVRPSSQWMRLR